ncbi:uncharacterized protein LOC126552721 [Aphis gossypii]|uniref:uncharacterized protein LOC126552721 n=1 Tax=Aphis gossypii TaxID=80765 RepID=UPI002158C0E9|nr:uncharacterized protein LOC126552721 [Aphis gossypii]
MSTDFISNLLSESEDEYSSTSYVPSDLNESSSDDTSISEIQNDNTQIIVNGDASYIADNDQSNEDINSNKGRKRIRDETKWKRNIRKIIVYYYYYFSYLNYYTDIRYKSIKPRKYHLSN